MKKQLYLLLSILVVAIQALEAYTVTANNHTNAAIKLEVWGASWYYGINIDPGKSGSIDTGGICPWEAKISDAAGLEQAPMSLEAHFATGDHCFNKTLDVTRFDKYQGQTGTVNVAATGGQVNIAQPILWRKFVVTCDKQFQTAHDKGDFSTTHESYIPSF